MGIFSLLICIIAAVMLYGTGLFIVGIVVAVLNFWSFGVMMNFKKDPDSMPGYAVVINMISTITGVILIIVSFL